MIRAVIADVDGVLVGKTPGVNFPIPNELVLEKLRQIRESGIPVVLCTAKSLHPILPIIEKSHLDNLHIADGGAVVADPLDEQTATHSIPKEIIEKVVYFALENNIYVELHALGKYFVQEDEVGEFTKRHAEIMQQEPIVVPSLLEVISKEEIIKIIFMVPGVEDKISLEPFFEGLQKDATVLWTIHNSMLPVQFAIITAHGVSKKHAAETIIKQLDISFDEVLGIGDTKGDWAFMQLCGYNGVVGEDEELIELVEKKEKDKTFFAPNVEEDGVLKVFEHFEL